jgi:hypothetical protein
MKKVSEFEANLRLAHVITTKNYKDYDMTDQPRGPRKIQRYFTKQDFLDGLCDASGRPIPGRTPGSQSRPMFRQASSRDLIL